MSRTINGNLTGRAAVIEIMELRARLFDDAARRRRRFWAAWRWNFRRLKRIDPNGWEAWYDARPEKTCGDMLPVIRARVEELKATLLSVEA